MRADCRDATRTSRANVQCPTLGAGRKARAARAVDLLIAATALASNLPLYTRNPRDFRGVEGLVEIVAVRRSGRSRSPGA